jgi:hypothetical protein
MAIDAEYPRAYPGIGSLPRRKMHQRVSRKSAMPVLLRNQVCADCVGLSAVGYAYIKNAEHFLAANRMPCCRKNALRKKITRAPGPASSDSNLQNI